MNWTWNANYEHAIDYLTTFRGITGEDCQQWIARCGIAILYKCFDYITVTIIINKTVVLQEFKSMSKLTQGA